MGQKMSSVEDARAQVATPSPTPMAFAPYYGDYINHSRTALLRERQASTRPCKAPRSNRIIAFHSKASFSGYIEASKAFPNLVVIHFTNSWYGPCQYMEPTFNEFATIYSNVEFVKINTDELHEISRKYGVRAMPAFLFIKRGVPIDKVVGSRKEELQLKIEKHRGSVTPLSCE